MTRALILVGHGSHLNADSSAPVYAHAAAIRASGAFDEVHEAFWKEEPPLTSVLHLSGADEVLIVPLFLSEGYFTREVLPREIGLTGAEMRSEGRLFRYLPPVGTHPSMSRMILKRADRVLGTDSRRRGEAALVIIGHGTERNATSADTVYALVDRLREDGDFGSVTCGFLDEAPNIADVVAGLDAPEVVLVPFFVAEGWHTRETIPEELGLTGEVTNSEGRTLWYTPPVGTLPEMTEVIVEMAAGPRIKAPATEPQAAEEPVATAPAVLPPFPTLGDSPTQPADAFYRDHSSAQAAFMSLLDESGPPVEFMDVLIEALPGPRYRLRHTADARAEVTSLAVHRDPEEASDIARFGEDGSYRPMRSTRDLRTGWTFESLDAEGLWRTLSLLYPAAIHDWFRGRRLSPEPNDFRAWAARQTAMYADVRKLEPRGVREVTDTLCASCHRSRLWRDEAGSGEDEVAVGAGASAGDGPAARGDRNSFAALRTGLVDLTGRHAENQAASADIDSGKDDATGLNFEHSSGAIGQFVRTRLVVPCLEPCTLFATRARDVAGAIDTTSDLEG